MRFTKYILNVLLLVASVASQTEIIDANNVWITPQKVGGNPVGVYSKNEVYNLGSYIVLRWNSTFPNVTLTINQDVPRGGVVATVNNLVNPGSNAYSYGWTVAVPQGMNLSEINVFWFTFWNGKAFGSSNGNYILSHYFNITSASVAQTTQSTTASAAGSSSSTQAVTFASAISVGSTTTAPASTATQSPTTSPASENSGGLSSGAKIGIGVGVSLGVLCLILGGAVIWLIRRRRPAKAAGQEKMGPPPTYAHAEQKPHEMPPSQVHEMGQQQYQQQSGANETYELPAR